MLPPLLACMKYAHTLDKYHYCYYLIARLQLCAEAPFRINTPGAKCNSTVDLKQHHAHWISVPHRPIDFTEASLLRALCRIGSVAIR